MSYNDCIDCKQPIEMYKDRCDSCTEKHIMCLSDGAAMVDMENGILKQKLKQIEDILNAPSKYPNGCDEMDALEECEESLEKIREVIEKKT